MERKAEYIFAYLKFNLDYALAQQSFTYLKVSPIEFQGFFPIMYSMWKIVAEKDL